MIEGIRRRLTLGYVGIFAPILALLGAVVLATFAVEFLSQQVVLLGQKLNGTRDYVQERFFKPERRERPEGRPPEGSPPPGEKGSRGELEHGEDAHQPSPVGPVRASTDDDIGVAALALPEDAGGTPGRAFEASSSASSPGLPFDGAAAEAAREDEVRRETLEGPEGERMRVVSVPVTGPGDEVVVVQVAQPRRVVLESVRDLAFVLVPAGVGGFCSRAWAVSSCPAGR